MRRLSSLAIVLALSASPVLAQTKGDVIVPPPIKQDGSVVTPPAAHVDPGIQAPKPPNQGQLPDKDKDAPKEEMPSTTRP